MSWSEKAKKEWQQGWQNGHDMAQSLGRPVRTEDFPKNFVHRGNAYCRGYAEGVIAGNIYLPKPNQSSIKI